MRSIVLIICILCVISCNRFTREYETDLENPMLKSIEELHSKDKQAYMNGDFETLLTLFTDDGILIPPEGEIIEAIRRGARTVAGVKYRTRAGMGRCQQDYCGPQIVEILARELGIPKSQVLFKGPGSELVQ